MDIDTGELECPDEVPTLPDEGRLLLYLSEKIIKHKVRVNGGIELPRLPQFSPPPKSNVLEDIRWVGTVENISIIHEASAVGSEN